MRDLFEVVRRAFHDPDARAYQVVATVVWALIVVSVALFSADLVFRGEGEAWPALERIDRALLVVFAAEYVLRVATFSPADLRVFRRAPLGTARAHALGRLRYMLHPLLLVDLVTVAALVPELRGLRALRLLRLLRTIRVFRYGNPFTGLFHAFERDRLLFLMAFSFLALEVVFGGGSLYLVEREHNPDINSLADGAWFALVTLTTVGFGDVTPITPLGRIITSVLMVGGMFTLAMFAGIVGHSLLNAVLSLREEQFRMGPYADHIVVCGYEEGMSLLLDALVSEHNPESTKIVLIADVDRPIDIPAELYWVRGDPSKESELDKVRIDRAAAVVVAGARRTSPQQADAVTLLTVFTIRSYLAQKPGTSLRRRPVYLVAEILDSENVQHARAAGADEVIETRRLGFSLLAHAIGHHGTADTLSQVVLRGESSLYVGVIPEGFERATFGEMRASIDLRSRGGLIIGVTHPDSGIERVNPPEDLRLASGSYVLYLAPERLLDAP